MIEFSANRTIAAILQDSFYEIPRFQRPFSWTLDNVGDLWSDTVQQSSDQYFIGAFIVYRRGGDSDTRPVDREYAIVDGQQRLTTLTVLLAALRDFFEELGQSDLARGVHRYIVREDRRNQPQLVITTEGGFPYFQTAIQSYPAIEGSTSAHRRQDERLLAQAYDYFRTQLLDLGRSVRADTTIRPEDREAALVAELEMIRDRILGLSAILVCVDDEDSAYEIFETLNARGKDLSLADLLRNFLLRDLREQTDDLDVPRHRFNTILTHLQQPDSEISSDDFILHSWLSRHTYTGKRALFPEIKRVIRSTNDKARLLRELEEDCEIYRMVRRPRSVTWTTQMEPIARSLRALESFGVTQPIPLLLAALRAYRNADNINLRTLKRLFSAVESFHFQYTAVVGRSSSGGISRRYALHARNFVGADQRGCLSNVDELVDKLKLDAPKRDEFVAGFSELSYASANTSKKNVVRYALERIYEYSAGTGVVVNFSQMTLEHVSPENPGADEEEIDPHSVESIGNLMLVSENLNNRLGNRSFTDKQRILRSENHLWIDDMILNATSWSGQEIAARGKSLGEIAQSQVWKL